MVIRNPHFEKLQAHYLFYEIAQRKERLLKEQPTAKLISLGIGDTTEPIPSVIAEALQSKASQLSTKEGYTGYGEALGDRELRRKIAEVLYQNRVDSEDIFISDGAKCDLGRLQLLFGAHCRAAIQDPSYPAYISATVLSGKTGPGDPSTQGYEELVLIPCRPENHFFPDVKILPHTDLIYLCSPNNPTGTVLTHQQLEDVVAFARKNRSIIIFDSAYANFIQDPALPRSIYEIEGADQVAIETGSFSKLAGFTGVRLGWTIVPKALQYENGGSIRNDWIKILSTFFNGASNIAQEGGKAVLSPEGLQACTEIASYYLENASLLKQAIEPLGYACYGGENAPYLWVDLQGASSWEVFDRLLKHAHVVSTPGVGFGPSGEGFLRLSAFGHRENILEAGERLKTALCRDASS